MARHANYKDLTYGVEELKKETRQRKKAETALRRTEALASALLNASADSAVLVDASGSILAINEFALKNLNQPNANVIHQNIFDLLPPDVAAGRKARAEDVIRTGEPIQFEDEMAGAASHELNQPLQVISGYAELLLRELPEDHSHYEYIQEIKKHIDRLGEVTRKIMRITKYETLDYIDGVKIIDIHKASTKN